MSSGAAADFVTGAGAGFAGAVAGLVVGGGGGVADAAAAVAAAVATAAAAGGGGVGALASTVLLTAGVAGAGVSCIGDPAVMAAAGSAVPGALPGALLGSFVAIGALGGPAQADRNIATNATARCGGGIQNTLVRDISSPIKGKQGQVNIICGNLRP